MREHAIGRDMECRALHQPSVAVNTGSLIPPALLSFSVHTHRHRIQVVPVGGIGRDINIHGSIATPVAVEYRAVHPNSSVRGDTVKLQFNVFPLVFGCKAELPPIPSESAVVIPLRKVGGRIYPAFDCPVVGQIERPPRRIIVNGGSSSPHASSLSAAVGLIVPFYYRTRDVAQMETPSFIQ